MKQNTLAMLATTTIHQLHGRVMVLRNHGKTFTLPDRLPFCQLTIQSLWARDSPVGPI